MAKQIINLGTAPTGSGGDTPRTAFQKAIDNFTELYLALGASGDPVALPSALPINKGGTGGTDQATARTALGLGSAAVENTVPVAKGGTGVTTIAALVSAIAAAGAYAKSNILGTVSQASGVPTGAIVENGTNANGTYTKFADGTMFAWRTVSFASPVANTYYSGPAALPAAFVGSPLCFVQQQNTNTNPTAFLVQATASGSTATFTWTFNVASTNSMAVFVVGRWF